MNNAKKINSVAYICSFITRAKFLNNQQIIFNTIDYILEFLEEQ